MLWFLLLGLAVVLAAYKLGSSNPKREPSAAAVSSAVAPNSEIANLTDDQKAMLALQGALEEATTGWQGPLEGPEWQARLWSAMSKWARKVGLAREVVEDLAGYIAAANKLGVQFDEVRAAEALVGEYGRLLESEGVRAVRVYPLSSLPTDVETIKAALQLVARAHWVNGTLDANTVSILTYAYGHLAHYADDDLADRARRFDDLMAEMAGRGPSEMKKSAGKVVALGDVAEAGAQANAAGQRLQAEFSTFLRSVVVPG